MRTIGVPSGLAVTVVCVVIALGAPAGASAARCAGSEAPAPRVGSGLFFGVAATSACNVWAVGLSNQGNGDLVEHWDGTAWKVQKRPNIGNADSGVAAVSARDVWTVGYINNERCSSCPNRLRAQAAHWNGKAWKLHNLHRGTLDGVAAMSARDVWAVGSFSATDYAKGTLIERWNGKTWKVQPSPNVGLLSAVTATSATNAWAVGGSAILHWNGMPGRCRRGPRAPCSSAWPRYRHATPGLWATPTPRR